MKGPFELSQDNIDKYVPSMPGAYCLTYSSANKNIACYVGRSDDNLNSRLKDHLPENESNACIKKNSVDKFYFQETNTAKESYELECK